MSRPTLDMVMDRRREDVAARKARRSLAQLEAMLPGLPPTRGFARALCGAKKPGVIAEIKQAIPNLCRCGVYPRLVQAIQRAARVSARQERISAAPAPGISPEDAAAAVPALRPANTHEEQR